MSPNSLVLHICMLAATAQVTPSTFLYSFARTSRSIVPTNESKLSAGAFPSSTLFCSTTCTVLSALLWSALRNSLDWVRTDPSPRKLLRDIDPRNSFFPIPFPESTFLWRWLFLFRRKRLPAELAEAAEASEARESRVDSVLADPRAESAIESLPTSPVSSEINDSAINDESPMGTERSESLVAS